MAIIPQKQLFSWKEIENLGDLSRLQLVLNYLPDEPLMRALESQRGKGRDEYPVRTVWNSILAGVREDGTVWQKIVKWFGYKLHLIVDADYELPVAFEVTKASCSEIPQGRKLLKKLKERHEELIKEDCNALIADWMYRLVLSNILFAAKRR